MTRRKFRDFLSQPHEMGSSDEATYYLGDQYEMGGVDFRSNDDRASQSRGHAPHQRGWDRPGRRSSDYGVRQERVHKYTSRTDYHGSADDDELDIGVLKVNHYGKGPKGYRPSDEKIKEEVCEELYHHADVDAREIIVDVEEGHVFLRGMVDSRKTKKMAERCLEHLPGIQDIHNELLLRQIDSQHRLSPGALEDLDRFRSM